VNEQELNNIIDQILEQTGTSVDKAIPILQAIQKKYNYLPEQALERVCELTDITPSQLSGISTFYSQFRHHPVGKHIIRVCVGTACHVKGAGQVYDAFRRELNLTDHHDTDAKGLFTIEKVACLGCCTLAPVVQIDDKTYGHVATGKVAEIIDDFIHSRNQLAEKSVPVNNKHAEIQGEIRIGLGSCCVASGSQMVKEELEKTLSESNINVKVKHVGCVGICNQVPMLEVIKTGEETTFYTKIKPEEVDSIIKHHFKSKSPFHKLKTDFYRLFEDVALDGMPQFMNRYDSDQPDTPVAEFLKGQMAIATENRGALKPAELDEYMEHQGFDALKKCLNEYTPQQVIDQINESGLQGRGGGGFRTGLKWQLVHDAVDEQKYVICNGDEGDPGAFMDRMLLESYPFRIIEGMIIAGYATGANQGLFYIRAEYPLAVKRIREAIEICSEQGILGEHLFGSSFSFQIDVFEGAGAFVCGEETALIASVEGRRGLPVMRPPFPSEKGLWGKPTLINNTETFSLISWIIRHGAASFNSIGTLGSKGTKVFALAGKIQRGGLIEVPMGITIRQIVEEIGGGMANGRTFKAIQIGGPSGGCIPASMMDTPIDFDSLKSAGAMMGSGGLIVLDDTDCMVDIARYFLSFTQDQSCGRCTFCRIGTRKMLDILDKISTGKGTMEDLDLLENLAEKTKQGSICGLGKTAPNPVLSTLKYFRAEYIAHIQGKCPTGKCKEMIHYSITEDCIGCTKCAQRCPTGAIEMKPYEIHSIDLEKCIKCDICKQICPTDAVIIS